MKVVDHLHTFEASSELDDIVLGNATESAGDPHGLAHFIIWHDPGAAGVGSPHADVPIVHPAASVIVARLIGSVVSIVFPVRGPAVLYLHGSRRGLNRVLVLFGGEVGKSEVLPHLYLLKLVLLNHLL